MIDTVRSEATMCLLVDIRPAGLTGEFFAERLLETLRIAVMPGESFGTAATGQIRLALKVEDAQLVQAT